MVLNPSLPVIKPGWEGNPLDRKGRFTNHEFPHIPRFRDVWRWQTGPRPMKNEKKQDKWVPEIIRSVRFRKSDRNCVVWLGHAWFMLRLGGITMLIDPVLYPNRFLRHRLPHPYGPEELGPVDFMLITHDHRDHCDEKSIRRICALNPGATIITGLHMGHLLRRWSHNHILEMGWYQQTALPDGLKITFLPARHWARRLLRDTNHRLWGAFCIEHDSKTIYMGGDSGYGGHFGELPSLFPKIDLACMGIGAFMPEWFMSPVHMSPADAVQAFNDSGAHSLLPMHYGMLDLSDEPPGLPYQMIREYESSGMINGQLHLPAVGETLWI